MATLLNNERTVAGPTFGRWVLGIREAPRRHELA
jgi:hypothetical protein